MNKPLSSPTELLPPGSRFIKADNEKEESSRADSHYEFATHSEQGRETGNPLAQNVPTMMTKIQTEGALEEGEAQSPHHDNDKMKYSGLSTVARARSKPSASCIKAVNKEAPTPKPVAVPRQRSRALTSRRSAARERRVRRNQNAASSEKSKKKSSIAVNCVDDIVGSTVQVPAHVFFVDDPFLYYTGDVIRPDPKRKNAVEVSFRSDNSLYWFPIEDVRKWLTDMRLRGVQIFPQTSSKDKRWSKKKKGATPEKIDRTSSATALMAAEVLARFPGSVLEQVKDNGTPKLLNHYW